MLTAKQNMQEVIKGGNPERFVNQFEAVQLLFHPYVTMPGALLSAGQENVVNPWGVTNSFPANVPGQFPVHTAEKIVVKDIEHWQDYVTPPSLDYPNEMWDGFKEQYAAVDGDQAYKATFIAPGMFEQTHHLCEISRALEYYALYPDEMHDLIKCLTEWELRMLDDILTKLKPTAIFHHDDWGGEKSTFMSPNMFADFFLEPYKEIYKLCHDKGAELVIHHSDSYSATLVPHMIEMGIDVWQGGMASNNFKELVPKYGPQITFMGGIDNKQMDFPGWTREDCAKAARAACEIGTKYYIPCITQGGGGSVYPGAYAVLAEEIDKMSAEVFGIKVEDITRLPHQILF